MTDKNEIEKEPVKETKSRKKKQEVEASHEIEAKQELDSEAVEEGGPYLKL